MTTHPPPCYSGRKADRVKVSVALSNSFFLLGRVLCFRAVRSVYNMPARRARHARHEQPQHKLLLNLKANRGAI